MKTELHIQDYLQVIKRRRWVILTCFVVLVVTVLIWTLKQTPIYEATTMLLIEPGTPQILSVEEVKPLGANLWIHYEWYYETQYKLIKGHILLKKVVDKLGWKADNPHEGFNQVHRLLGAIQVNPVKNSQLVDVSVQDPDPQMTAKIANTLADEYIKQNLERNTSAASSAAEWLSKRIEEQKQKLKDAELVLAQYRADHNITILPQMTGESANESLKTEYVRFLALLANYSERYTDKHPKVIELRAQIDSLRNKIHGLEDIDKGKVTMEYRVLEKEVQMNKRMYEILLERLKEIDLSSNLNVNNISVVNRAEVPKTPVKPNLPRSLMLSVVFGLFIGVALAFFVDYLDTTIKSPQDIKEVLEAHFIGSIPGLEGKDEIKRDKIVHVKPKSPAAEAYRDVRTEVLSLARQEKNSVILITSAEPKAGKTITVTNLGIALSQMGSSVLLVDSDLRKPQLHKIFNVDRRNGLSEYLLNNVNINSIIKDAGIENLKLVTGGKISQAPAEIIGSEKMDELIQDVKQKFDFILFDSPPIASVSDAVILANLVDATIQVVRSGKVLVPIVLRAKEKLENSKAKLLGIILNDLKTYHDNYYYYKYYRYYGDEDKKKRDDINTEK